MHSCWCILLIECGLNSNFYLNSNLFELGIEKIRNRKENQTQYEAQTRPAFPAAQTHSSLSLPVGPVHPSSSFFSRSVRPTLWPSSRQRTRVPRPAHPRSACSLSLTAPQAHPPAPQPALPASAPHRLPPGPARQPAFAHRLRIAPLLPPLTRGPRPPVSSSSRNRSRDPRPRSRRPSNHGRARPGHPPAFN